MNDRMRAQLQTALTELETQGLYRRPRTIESAPGAHVQMDGRDVIMCGANNYLGLAGDPRLQHAAIAAVVRFGVGSSGSRLLSGNTVLHEELEARIAAWKGTEAAIVCNTGYMANVAAITALTEAGDVILSDALNHASIIDACRMSRAKTYVYPHADMRSLAGLLAEHAGTTRRVLVVTDGVFSMDGDVAPFADLVRLTQAHDAWLMVDDAHGTGVLGTQGRGSAHEAGVADGVTVQMGTLSKAIGAEGGYIAGSRELIAWLRNRARPYIFSTALAPATIGAAIEAIAIVQEEESRRERLRLVSQHVRHSLRDAGFTVLGDPQVPILPVILGDPGPAMAMANALWARSIYAPGIRPPSVPVGQSRIRLTLMATHSDEDIEAIITGFVTVGQERGWI